jgi:RNA polymerase sigma-70 factor
MTEDRSSNKDKLQLALLEQNRQWLMAYVLSLTGQYGDSEDIVQDVFTTALEQQDRFDQVVTVGAWLRGIARNKVREYWRQNKQEPVLMSPEVLERLEEVAANHENQELAPNYKNWRLQILQSCMRRLTGRAREMLRLRYQERYRSQEIALRLKMAVSSVDMAMSRARKALRECVAAKIENVE